MSIKVIKSGMYTSVQDLGRIGYSEYGVPKGGAMDQMALKTANSLLGNQLDDACLEITMMGPVLQFQADTYIATAGAEFELFLDDEPIPFREAVFVKSNQVLKFGKLKKGIRIYLAVCGGIQTPKVLESRSLLKRVTSYYKIEDGMELPLLDKCMKPQVFAVPKPKDFNGFLEAYPGPEFESLSDSQKEQLHKNEFKVSHLNDRMAYQIEPNLDPHQIDQLTSVVMAGSVQLTPKGSLIILMRDGQTTGGYPRVLQLSEESIDLVAQMATASKFKFRFLTKFKETL
ncbi:MAG: biotin-dependent carboxyltransferase family protein [Flavobacteriaceae bacterium]|nr:biotin-dependent carboxyltransferase family protein [Flavobacteriaceae bacterium]NVJ73291.1 biotin-dependent carboxyltransferase family protein [Flavobacteriaceae bacterium]